MTKEQALKNITKAIRDIDLDNVSDKFSDLIHEEMDNLDLDIYDEYEPYVDLIFDKVSKKMVRSLMTEYIG